MTNPRLPYEPMNERQRAIDMVRNLEVTKDGDVFDLIARLLRQIKEEKEKSWPAISGNAAWPKIEPRSSITIAHPKRLVRNAARCRDCGETLESKHRHDWVQCKCGNYIDGGLEYVRMGFRREGALEDLCEYEDGAA